MPKNLIIAILTAAILAAAPAASFPDDKDTICEESLQHYKDGMDFFELGLFEKAGAEFTRAIEISPYFAEAYVALGNVYSIFRRYDKAIGCYRKAIVLNPNISEAHMGIGMAAVYEGDYQLAASAYQHAIQINYNNAKAYLFLGKVNKLMGDDKSAEENLGKAKELYDKDKK
jgi:tetratricopeptide (TPR) repeat protein